MTTVPLDVVSAKFHYCCPLQELSARDAGRFGAKAVTLGRLLQSGFPVPGGFAIGAEALDAVLSTTARTAADALVAELPSGLRDEIAAGWAHLGGGPVAVRSSALVEDGAESSFAGQYTTVLNVQGVDAIVDALRRCWSSAFLSHVARYAEVRGRADFRRMGVLVQRQLAPRCGGVAFSADPVSGDRSKVVINAVAGLADRLVSGAASGDTWYVEAGRPVCAHATENCLTPDDARAVAALARRVADHAGSPQDIEWAITDSGVQLLQARPITALPDPPAEPVPVPAKAPHGFWERNDTYYPYPLSPMFRSFFLKALNDAYRYFCADSGALAVGAESREIGGWVYVRIVPFGGRDVRLPPRWMMWLALKIVPILRERIAISVEAIRTRRYQGYVQRWKEQWLPDMERQARARRELDTSTLSDEALAEHARTTEQFVHKAVELHFLIVGAHFYALAELTFTCRDVFGWSEAKVLGLFAGLSDASTEPARALERLANLARARSGLRQAIVDRQPLARVLLEDEEFAAAFQNYLETCGHRVLRYEVSEPTVAERPTLVLEWVRGQLGTGYDSARMRTHLAEERAARRDEARRQLAERSPEDRQLFERALARAEEAYPLREENELHTLSAPLATLRYVLLRVGERLAAKKSLDRADHVFWLELPEALSALTSGARLQSLVERRRGEERWVKDHPGPQSYGRPLEIPESLPGLPPEAEFMFRAGLWMRDRGFAPAESARRHEPGHRLHGIAASGGTYTGPARIVRDESEFGKITAGDVLVCPTTSPVWSALFANIGALVTDRGGTLSHAAIIAREYGMPAVVATGNATQILRDGQVVTVDGHAGTIAVLDDAAAPAV